MNQTDILTVLNIFLQKLGRSQPECIDNHGNGTEAHCGGSYHRGKQQAEDGKQNARSNRHADGVVNKRKEQVLFDVSHHFVA